MTRLSRRQRRLVFTGLLAAGVGVILIAALRRNGRDGYPVTPAGWAAMWDEAARASGRTPGESWDVWLGAAAEVKAAVGDATAIDLDRAARALDLLADQQRFTFSYPPGLSGTDVQSAQIGQYSPMRDAVRHAVMQGFERAMINGHQEEAAAWLRRGVDVMRVTDGTGCATSAMTRIALERIMHDLMRRYVLAGGELDDGMLDAIGDTDLAWALRGEKVVELGTMSQWIDEMPFWRDLLVADDQMDLYAAFMDDWLRAVESGDPAGMEVLDRESERWGKNAAWSWVRRPVLAYVMPTWHGSLMRMQTTAALERDALRVMQALNSHRSARGRFPERLDELVPEWLGGLPTDPFASDGRIRYVLLDAESDPSLAYVLYSVGINGTDEGGMEDPLLSGMGLANQNHTGDHVFNRTDRALGTPAGAAGGSGAGSPTDPSSEQLP
jgi:hypothetical protein